MNSYKNFFAEKMSTRLMRINIAAFYSGFTAAGIVNRKLSVMGYIFATLVYAVLILTYITILYFIKKSKRA